MKENSIESNYKRVRKTKKLKLFSPEKKNIIYVPELRMESHTNKSIEKFIKDFPVKIKLVKSNKNRYECRLEKLH